jgi:stage II sporulation protein D
MRIRSTFFILLLLLSISGCIRAVPGNAGDGDKIRVLVLNGAESVSLRGVGSGAALDIRRDGRGVTVNGHAKTLPLRFEPEGEFVYVNNRPYRGSIEVFPGGDGLMVINELPLEHYLVGIINNEISSKWPEESIKAQAVIARTYAIYIRARKNALYDIEGSVLGQVYSGAAAEDRAAQRAVSATAGEILTYDGEPALTVYHSNAGGMTASSKDVWQSDYPYLRPVDSPYDEYAPRYSWDFSIDGKTLGGKLRDAGFDVGEPEAIEPAMVTDSGRIKSVVIWGEGGHQVRLTGENLRKVVGYGKLRSTRFEVRKNGDTFLFIGRGSGHGVGLSQWGAKGMAGAGYTYREILRHYYPGTELEKAY